MGFVECILLGEICNVSNIELLTVCFPLFVSVDAWQVGSLKKLHLIEFIHIIL
jgi:hypothetical protein